MKVYILVQDYKERGILIGDTVYIYESEVKEICEKVNSNKPSHSNVFYYYVERELEERR